MALVLKINEHAPEPLKITKAVEILKGGGIIVYPTDTIYGLGCDIFNKKAVARIYQFKKREAKKPLSIICKNFQSIAEYALVQDYAFRLMRKTLPGPYTFVLKAKNNMPKTFLAKNKTVGVRIPQNNICLNLVEKLGGPIISTSLNVSSERILTNPDQLSKEMKNKIDLIIDAGRLMTEPSSVIDLSGDKPVILRAGQGDLTLFQV